MASSGGSRTASASTGSSGGTSETCSLTVSPSTVNFGIVEVGEEVGQTVTLSNRGTSSCQVTGIGLAAASASSFSVAAPLADLSISPGESGGIFLTAFSPTSPLSGVQTGSLVFNSNDPTLPSGSVKLSAIIETIACYGGNGCGGEWPQWHGDNDDDGQGDVDTTGNQGTVLWTYPVGVPPPGQTYEASPVLDGLENVYILDWQGILHAIDTTGAQLWQATLQAGETPVVELSGGIFDATTPQGADAGGSDAFIVPYAGQPAAQSYGYSFISNPNLGSDGTIYLAGLGPSEGVTAVAVGTNLTLTTGMLPLPPWTSHVGVAVTSSNEMSFWAGGGVVAALTPPFLGPAQSLMGVPTWPDAGVVVASNAADPSAGPVISDVALDEAAGLLFVYSAWEQDNAGSLSVQGNVVALDTGTGAQVWSFQLTPAILPAGSVVLPSDCGHASPAISVNGVVYVGNGDGLRAIDGATGQLQWLFPSSDVTAAPLVTADGTIFFGTADGHLDAVTSGGALRFQVTTGGRISSSPALGGDGTVFFVSDDGNLYAAH